MAFNLFRRASPLEELTRAAASMKFPVIYSADNHGNEGQYKQLVRAALAIGAKAIIIGGDLAPKDQDQDYIGVQRRFLDNILPKIFAEYRQALPEGKVFLMLGNDDAKSNEDVLSKHRDVVTPIHMSRQPLTADTDIIGYSTVPVTPFGIKDFEKFDLTHVKESDRTAYQSLSRSWELDGVLSNANGWQRVSLNPQDASTDSIEIDINQPLFTENARNGVYIFHAPPFGTKLDRLYGGEPVGSIAVRRFIQDFQPRLTLHGHIHETVEASGAFLERIGSSVALSPGNMPEDKHAMAILVDIYDPASAVRTRLKF